MNWLFTAQHRLKYITIAAFLACSIALTALGEARAADGSGLSLQLLSDQANPTNTYPLSDAPGDAIKLIMVLKNISAQQINVERGLSQAELHRSLIVTDPCGNILELSPDAESFIFDAPPPRFVGGLPLIPAEILQPDFVRSLTIQDLRQLFPSMKKLPGTYRVTAQQTASRFVWTITDPNRGLQGVADHPGNWFGTINAQEMQIYISPTSGAQLEVTLTDADSQPLFQVPVKAFKTSEIPDGYEPADTWSTIEPILSGVTDTKGRTIWGVCKTCVPADDYTILAFYKDEFLVSEIAASDSGWNAGCSGLLAKTITYSEAPPPAILGDLNGDNCVDRSDYDILIADIRNGEPNDPAYDLNGDGAVNIADARYLVTIFTNPRGAPCQ